MEYAETNSVLVEFEFFCGKMYCRGGSRLNRPYKQVLSLQINLLGRPGNRPYKCMICRDGSIGAADQIVPINNYEPPLKIDSVVVVEALDLTSPLYATKFYYNRIHNLKFNNCIYKIWIIIYIIIIVSTIQILIIEGIPKVIISAKMHT